MTVNKKLRDFDVPVNLRVGIRLPRQRNADVNVIYDDWISK